MHYALQHCMEWHNKKLEYHLGLYFMELIFAQHETTRYENLFRLIILVFVQVPPSFRFCVRWQILFHETKSPTQQYYTLQL